MTQQSKVREILEFVWSLSPHNKNRMAEAEQALYDAMLGVIGEDEVHTIPVGAALNELRAEQRKALNALFGKNCEME